MRLYDKREDRKIQNRSEKRTKWRSDSNEIISKKAGAVKQEIKKPPFGGFHLIETV